VGADAALGDLPVSDLRFAIAVLLAFTVVAASGVADARRSVNITADSEPGWIPAEDLERQVLQVMNTYFAAFESGRYDEAHAMMTDGMKANLSASEYATAKRELHFRSGKLRDRKILKVTWSKNPQRARTSPGIFAAVDVATRYANIDRHCGYVMLHQEPTGGPFKVMREEANFIDNETASGMSPDELTKTWAQLAANCPNYVPEVGPARP
jgi:hypothetical protein